MEPRSPPSIGRLAARAANDQEPSLCLRVDSTISQNPKGSPGNPGTAVLHAPAIPVAGGMKAASTVRRAGLGVTSGFPARNDTALAESSDLGHGRRGSERISNHAAWTGWRTGKEATLFLTRKAGCVR